MSKDKISVIGPCYNEEEALPIFYKEIDKISKEMPDVDFEFLFIDDGSKDKTLEIIRELAESDSRVRYVSFSRNFGKEAAMYAGLQNASGNLVTTMDVDMQDPPYMVKKMYSLLKKGDYDCVGLYTTNHKDYSWFRKLCTNIWYKIISKISSGRQVPGVRDFRLMKRKMVDAVLKLDEYNRYIKGIFSFVGFETKWLEYEPVNRVAGKTKFNFWKLFKYALEGTVAFSTTPLVLSAVVGIVFCFISLIFILVIVIKTLVWGDPVSGWPSLTCIILFVSGIQLFFLGVVGIYLSKIYLEVKKRPIYLVAETEKDLIK